MLFVIQKKEKKELFSKKSLIPKKSIDRKFSKKLDIKSFEFLNRSVLHSMFDETYRQEKDETWFRYKTPKYKSRAEIFCRKQMLDLYWNGLDEETL